MTPIFSSSLITLFLSKTTHCFSSRTCKLLSIWFDSFYISPASTLPPRRCLAELHLFFPPSFFAYFLNIRLSRWIDILSFSAANLKVVESDSPSCINRLTKKKKRPTDDAKTRPRQSFKACQKKGQPLGWCRFSLSRPIYSPHDPIQSRTALPSSETMLSRSQLNQENPTKQSSHHPTKTPLRQQQQSTAGKPGLGLTTTAKSGRVLGQKDGNAGRSGTGTGTGLRECSGFGFWGFEARAKEAPEKPEEKDGGGRAISHPFIVKGTVNLCSP